MKGFIILATLILGGTSCQKWKVDPEIDNINDFVVVNTALSPSNKVVSVYVGRVNANFGTVETSQKLALTDAEVYLRESQVKQRLVFSAKTKLYEVDSQTFPIIAGKTYALEVVVGTKKVTASCQIPEKVLLPLLEAQQNGRLINSSVSWKASKANQAFMLLGYSFYENQGGPVITYANWDFNQSELIVSVENEQTFTKNNEIGLNIDRVLPPFIDVFVEINQYDENAQKYLTSIKNSNDTPQLSVDFFDKFSSPTIRYSNVNNGLGIMIGYNRYIIKKAIPIVR